MFSGHNNREPRVLTGTDSLADVAARARGGEGHVFGGLSAGADHVIDLRLSRRSGKVRREKIGEWSFFYPCSATKTR